MEIKYIQITQVNSTNENESFTVGQKQNLFGKQVTLERIRYGHLNNINVIDLNYSEGISRVLRYHVKNVDIDYIEQ